MVGIVVVLLIGIGVVVKNIIGLSLEKKALEQQNAELTDRRDDLTAELQNVNDPDYIEEQARKLLHMIKPGEVLYILNGSGHPKPENQDGTELELPTRPDAPTYEETQGEESEGSEEISEETQQEYSEESSEESSEGTYEETSDESSETTYEEESSEGDYTEESVEDGSDG